MELTAGTKRGSYEVLPQIDAGGMGEVHQAHDSKLGRDVAIKVVPEKFTRYPDPNDCHASNAKPEDQKAQNQVIFLENFVDEVRRNAPIGK
jgi:serine/threonine protein kinase